MLVCALAAFGLCDAVTAFSGSYPLTFAARLLAGVAGGVSWGMLAGYAARMVPAERQGRAIAVVLAGITIASFKVCATAAMLADVVTRFGDLVPAFRDAQVQSPSPLPDRSACTGNPDFGRHSGGASCRSKPIKKLY